MKTPGARNPNVTLFSWAPIVARYGDDEQEHGKRHRDLGQARDDRVDAPAEVTGEEAEQDADGDGEDGREDRDLERRLRAVEDSQEHVATELSVRAEDEGRVLEALRADGASGTAPC